MVGTTISHYKVLEKIGQGRCHSSRIPRQYCGLALAALLVLAATSGACGSGTPPEALAGSTAALTICETARQVGGGKGPGRWRHRLLINGGMASDDTDHTVFVAQSLLAHPDSMELFVRRLSRCFRWWFLSLPPGIGFATLRSILRSWLISPLQSGVYSAGNGPAMRSAP